MRARPRRPAANGDWWRGSGSQSARDRRRPRYLRARRPEDAESAEFDLGHEAFVERRCRTVIDVRSATRQRPTVKRLRSPAIDAAAVTLVTEGERHDPDRQLQIDPRLVLRKGMGVN